MKGTLAPSSRPARTGTSTIADLHPPDRGGGVPLRGSRLAPPIDRSRFPPVPELPEIAAYIHALEPRVLGATLLGVRVRSVALLRTWDPPLEAAAGRTVTGVRRLGKRIVLALTGDLFLALHLMIAGRLHWRAAGAPLVRKIGLAAFDFAEGTLVLTEVASKKRATSPVAVFGSMMATRDMMAFPPAELRAAGT